MCGRRKAHMRMKTEQDVYEGQTTRLDAQVAQTAFARHRMHWRGSFSWFMLWMIWPMIALVKFVTPLVFGLVTTTIGALNSVTVPLFPLVLIGLGVALLLRLRVRD